MDIVNGYSKYESISITRSNIVYINMFPHVTSSLLLECVYPCLISHDSENEFRDTQTRFAGIMMRGEEAHEL